MKNEYIYILLFVGLIALIFLSNKSKITKVVISGKPDKKYNIVGNGGVNGDLEIIKNLDDKKVAKASIWDIFR